MARCNVCFRQCEITEGSLGFCGGRICKDGSVMADNYGKVTSMALDPIEKKPLRRFYPGSQILSVGSYGCNLRCPFCQNHEITWSKEAQVFRENSDLVLPEELAETALYYKKAGNIGVAFTYNEPLIGYEYVRDTARLVHDLDMKNVLVTNGTAQLPVLEELLPYIDAMNIDLKGFSKEYYSDVLGGDLPAVLAFITEAVKHCHVELTTLIVPGENDSEEEMQRMTCWISELKDADGRRIGQDIPLHISRFFPRFHMKDREATNIRHIYRLAELAGENLRYVYAGNC